MTTLAPDYVYRYRHESVLDRPEGRLRLATFSDAEEAHPYFFRGDLVRPCRTADLLRGLMRVVQTRFPIPPAMLGRILAMADPVVACVSSVHALVVQRALQRAIQGDPKSMPRDFGKLLDILKELSSALPEDRSLCQKDHGTRLRRPPISVFRKLRSTSG